MKLSDIKNFNDNSKQIKLDIDPIEYITLEELNKLNYLKTYVETFHTYF